MSGLIPDELLADYSAGRLSNGWSLVVATHLALRPTERPRLRQFDTIGGVLLDEIEPAAPAETAFDSVLSRISETPDDAIVMNGAHTKTCNCCTPSDNPVLPEPLRSAVGGDVDDLKWQRLSGDVAQVLIDTDDETTMCRLLRVRAGRPVATHTHRGTELTLVLAGSFTDELGTYHRGDVEMADETVEHQPIAGEGADCVCFAVTSAPLKFRNPIVRMLQPLFRI
ncbi:MAG: ChrR family anti-sigma-E factor [Pseudomonadota bacterium]